VQKAYVIPATLDNVTQGELQMYKNNYKTLNRITTALYRNVRNTYEGSSEIESSHKDTYNS
jgi:hypothetical protein